MRRLLVLLVVSCLAIVPALANEEVNETKHVVAKGAVCPRWGFHEEYTTCTNCHGQKPLEMYRDEINYHYVEVRDRTLYLSLYRDIDAYLIQEITKSLRSIPRDSFDKVRVEIASHGGRFFPALSLISILGEMRANGKIVETVCYGYALSAGFLVLLSGSPGHRYCSSTSVLMWHEVTDFQFYSVETPSDKELEAQIFRMYQDMVNDFIAKRSKMSKKELDKRVQFKQLWVTGEDALKYGFVDHLIDLPRGEEGLKGTENQID